MSALPQPGDLIGVRYRIESLLGQGGMGAVFAALNQATGRAVAIKWMLPESARSRESLERFLSEARATAKIEHPNVIQILDVGQDGDAPFLVMERLRGESLADRLRRGRLSPHETLNLMIPACKGVREAHREGIIHRDLKPDNIFLCQGKDGSPRPPKVLDFGISKLFDATDAASSMTKTGISMGTPWYMSPEQLNAPKDADARFDVYAMGIVLYECLTGAPPYHAEGIFELVQQIAAGNPPPIRAVVPECPPELAQVVSRAMAADKHARYASMDALIGELERVQASISAGTPGFVTPPTAAMQSVGGAMPPVPFGTPAAYLPTTPAQAGQGGAPSTGPLGGGAWTPPPYGTPPVGPTGAMTPATGAARSLSSKMPIVIGAIAVLGLMLFGGVGLLIAFLLVGRATDAPERPTSGPTIGAGGGGGNVGDVGGGGGGVGGGGADPNAPSIALTFSGDCHPTFEGRRMVTVSNGIVSVTAISGIRMTGSLTLSLNDARGVLPLSTERRIEDQVLVNLMEGQTVWTNMSTQIVAIRNGSIADPISGSLLIRENDANTGRVDIDFQDVSLQDPQGGGICRISGRLQTSGQTYGM